MNLPTTMTHAGTLYTYFETVDDDKVVYHGALHTDILRQTLELIRTVPKRSGQNYGVRRGYLRFTEDRSVTNADATVVIQPSVTTMSINFPVGVSDTNAVVIEELQKLFGGATGGDIDDFTVDLACPGVFNDAYIAGHGDNVPGFVSLAAFFEDGNL